MQQPENTENNDAVQEADDRLRDQALSGEVDEDTAKLAEAIIIRSSEESAVDAEAGTTVPQEDEQPTDEQPTEGDADPAIAKVRKEAAGYRRKLREAEAQIKEGEAERDSLRTRAEALERKEVERQVSTGMRALAAGTDLWVGGVSLDELRDDEGAIDSEKVDAARERVLEQHPHWRKPTPDFEGGYRPGPTPPRQPDFAKSLRDAAGG